MGRHVMVFFVLNYGLLKQRFFVFFSLWKDIIINMSNVFSLYIVVAIQQHMLR